MRRTFTLVVFLAAAATLAGCFSVDKVKPRDERFLLAKVNGVLIEKSAVRSVAEVKPFASWRAACRYKGDSGTFVIQHWAIVNGVPCDSYANLEVGKTYEFLVAEMKEMVGLNRYSEQVKGWDLDGNGYACFDELSVLSDPCFVEIVYIPNVAIKTSNK